jgi:outer membrane protein OmpA-like peptidoglycan-associated protein
LDFFYLTGWGASFPPIVDDYRTRGNLVLSVGLTAYIGRGKKTPASPAEKPLAQPEPEIVQPSRERKAKEDDADGDGVNDLGDLCPDTPAGQPVDAFGCPLDSDGDGVIDREDQCGSTPTGALVNSVGCPLDSDGDGIYDGLDFCPNTRDQWRAHVDERGCVGDADLDGVPDFLDKCPNTAPGAAVDSTGCFPDEDGDGVVNQLDLCPGTPAGLAVDETGCLIMTQLDRKLLLFPDFEAGLTALDRISRSILDDLAIRLRDDTRVTVYIRAYTDNIGEYEANRAISQKRADKARQYLIDRGISPSRIEAIGLGEVDFLADNATAAGRKRNRRLEITYQR